MKNTSLYEILTFRNNCKEFFDPRQGTLNPQLFTLNHRPNGKLIRKTFKLIVFKGIVYTGFEYNGMSVLIQVLFGADCQPPVKVFRTSNDLAVYLAVLLFNLVYLLARGRCGGSCLWCPRVLRTLEEQRI